MDAGRLSSAGLFSALRKNLYQQRSTVVTGRTVFRYGPRKAGSFPFGGSAPRLPRPFRRDISRQTIILTAPLLWLRPHYSIVFLKKQGHLNKNANYILLSKESERAGP